MQKEQKNNAAKYLDSNKKEFIDNWWLNLGDVTKIRTTNIIGSNQLFKENPSLAIVDMMRKPENFAYTCDLLFNFHLHPFQAAILKILWTHPFSIFTASRGGSKSTLLAIYALLRAIFIPGSKVLFVGAAFRQSKIIFNYCESVWHNSPMLRDIFSTNKDNRISHDNDMYQFRLETSTITALPMGNGEKIRGQRSTCTISDEHNTLNQQIYQEVIQGFASVSLNPVEQVREQAKYEALYELGDISKQELSHIESSKIHNQQIISGTCGFTFEPLYQIWKQYHDIILSRGDKDKIGRIFNDGPPPGFDHKDYAIVRLPYELLPNKYMDEKTIGRAKATTHIGIFASEYQTVFVSDTQGFFRRTLIENCVVGKKPDLPIMKKCGEVDFTLLMEGHRNVKYVMGIDPAAESDNFAITILELWEDHRRVVYTWTTNNANHKAKLRHGLIDEHDYYRYCARKIRDLMKFFNIQEIGLDAQGGGKAISEILGDPKYLRAGEHPLYPIPDLKKPRDTDHLAGLHVLHLIEFSNSEWVYNANHALRQDMETRELIFPSCDSISFGLAHEQDKRENRLHTTGNVEVDGLKETGEDVLLEIEELKNELVLIEHTKTATGRDHWDTPKIKGLNSKKGRLRKDRYSALLMANAVGRAMIARIIEYSYDVYGGVAKDMAKNKRSSEPQHQIEIGDGYSFGFGIKKGKLI